MADFEIFYSWQSDLPNRTNRGFLRDALDRAANAVSAAAGVEEAVRVTSDTEGVPGSPNIIASILDKIDRSDGMVADVSIVTGGESGRPSPNPNVMFEVGYAAKALGWDRIILVANIACGPLEQMPFDFRGHRIVSYTFPDQRDLLPAAVRPGVVSQFSSRLAGILELGEGPPRYSDVVRQHWLPELDALRDILRDGLQAARRPSPPFYTRERPGMMEDKRPGEFVLSLSNPDEALRARAAAFLDATTAFSALWFGAVKAAKDPKGIYGPERPEIERQFAATGGQQALQAVESAYDAVHARINELLR